MSRRRGSVKRFTKSHEHLFTQFLGLHCPLSSAHTLLAVYGDVVSIRIYAEADVSEGGVNAPKVPLFHEGGRLRVLCPHCHRAGSRIDLQVRTERVVAVLDAMHEHGPHRKKLSLEASVLERFVQQHPLTSERRLARKITVTSPTATRRTPPPAQRTRAVRD